MRRTAKRTKQRQKPSRKPPPLTRSGKVRQGKERARKRKGPVPGGRAVATPWEWLERPQRRGMMWDGVGWDGCHATTRDGRGWLFSRLLGLASVRCWSTRVLPYSTSIQYRIWPYVQCNHAPHVDLDGGGGCMLSVSRCLLVKRQRRRRRGWTDLRDMVYFGDSSRRLTFALSDGGVLETAIYRFTLATRGRIYSTDILLNASIRISILVIRAWSGGNGGVCMCGYAGYFLF